MLKTRVSPEIDAYYMEKIFTNLGTYHIELPIAAYSNSCACVTPYSATYPDHVTDSTDYKPSLSLAVMILTMMNSVFRQHMRAC